MTAWRGAWSRMHLTPMAAAACGRRGAIGGLSPDGGGTKCEQNEAVMGGDGERWTPVDSDLQVVVRGLVPRRARMEVLRRKRKDKEGGPPEAEGGMGGRRLMNFGGKRKANALLLAKSSSEKKKVHWPDVQWAPPKHPSKHPSHGALSTTHDRDRGRECGAGGAS